MPVATLAATLNGHLDVLTKADSECAGRGEDHRYGGLIIQSTKHIVDPLIS